VPFDTLASGAPRRVPAPQRWAGIWSARAWPVGLAIPLALLAALELGVRLSWLPGRLLPPPSQIARTLIELAGEGLPEHVAVSVLRVAAGFGLGAALGVAAGALVGLSRRAQALLDPTFQGLRAIPSLAWVPLLLLWLGIDEAPKLALIALGSFFPVYLNLVSGIHNVDRKWIEVGQMAGLRGLGLVRRILLPAALPGLFTGLRTGLSLSWMFLVAAELIAATRGVGYLLSDGRETGRPDIVVAAIFLLAVMGKLSDSALQALERRCLGWRDVYATRAHAQVRG
jgi:sulfonate transport system permease protein